MPWVVGMMPGVGDVAVMRLPGGGYGAGQVTAIGGGVTTACALAWYSAERPELGQLASAGPLVLDHHGYRGEPALVNIVEGDLPPPDWEWLGCQPVPAGVPASGNSFSGWSWLPRQIVGQRRWDQRLPAAVKQAYRAGATRGQVEVDFGAGPVTMGAATGRLDLTGDGPVRPPASGVVRWRALDQLPRCTSLVWSGPDRGLTAALADHPVIDNLTWRQAPSTVDLRGTGLTSLSISGDIELVRLPADLDRLSLDGDGRIAAVDAADNGRWLDLGVETSTSGVHLPAGLDRLRNLTVAGPGTISAAPLSGLADLESLSLAWRGAPGALAAAPALATLVRLARLTMTDAYGIDVDTLPDLPALTGLSIHGLRRTSAAAVKARYRRTGVHLAVTGAKNDTWLAANLTNPLRDWADDHSRGGAAACKAYATAVRALDALPADGTDPTAAAQPVLRGFVEQLDRINKRYGFIDTVLREDAGDAFINLAARAGIPTDIADQWFDSWRDF